jgi:hypothetical protein
MKEKAFETKVEKEYGEDGFQMTFTNGCTISVIFGKHTYSDNGETTAEVAAWHSNGNWMYHQEGDWIELLNEKTEVMPCRTADEVAQLIYSLSQYK